MTQRVQVADADGRVLYRGLVDDGGSLLRFASGFGFVTRDDIRRNRWKIVSSAEIVEVGRDGSRDERAQQATKSSLEAAEAAESEISNG